MSWAPSEQASRSSKGTACDVACGVSERTAYLQGQRLPSHVL